MNNQQFPPYGQQNPYQYNQQQGNGYNNPHGQQNPYNYNQNPYQQNGQQDIPFNYDTEANRQQNQNAMLGYAQQQNQTNKGILQRQLPPDDDYPPFDFKDNKVRLGFIRKVYLILSAQLLITFFFVLIAFLSDSFQQFQRDNVWLVIVCAVVTLITIYALACYRKIARSVPINYILLLVFTLAESYIVSYIASQYNVDTVLIAAGLTVGMVVGLTLYAIFTKTDFTKCGGILVVCLVVFIIGGIIMIFIRNFWARIIYACIGVILFGIYLVFDTQLVIGKNSRMYSIDDYVMAAANLYIDIIQIFLFLLQIVGMAGGGN